MKYFESPAVRYWKDLGLSTRAANRLLGDGATEVRDLSNYTWARLLALPDMGVVTAREIVAFAGRHEIAIPDDRNVKPRCPCCGQVLLK